MRTLEQNAPAASGIRAAWHGLNRIIFLLVKVTGAIALLGWWTIPPLRWFAEGHHSTAAWWWLGGGYVLMMIASTLAYLSALGSMMDPPEKNPHWIVSGWFGVFLMLFVYFAPAALIALLAFFAAMNPNPSPYGQDPDNITGTTGDYCAPCAGLAGGVGWMRDMRNLNRSSWDW